MRMKNVIAILSLLAVSLVNAQAGAPASPYYDGFNWNQSGMALKNALDTKLTSTHTNFISYTPGVWNACKATDLDPANPNNVLLIYGWENGSDGDITNDLSRNKNANGGNNGDWNREHVFAKSLGTPVLNDGGISDAGEDAHHLRAADVQRNSTRGNQKFAAGSGNSADVLDGWYPGDRWKGDVARMMMYMYLRYDTQCLPTAVGTGTITATDPNMLDLFLQWNAEDPVDAFEDNRNTYHGNTSNTYAQGNRNPFIDNPYLATLIWGGPVAENRWPLVYLSTTTFDWTSKISVYPIPSNNNTVTIESEVPLDTIHLLNYNGQILQRIELSKQQKTTYTLENLPKGFYFLTIFSENQSTTKKIILN